MTHEQFHALLTSVFSRIEGLLGSKNEEYARGTDKLHNFKRAAAYLGCSPVVALHGMQAKHTISIADMIDDLAHGRHHTQEKWLEKLGDRIAYDILMLGLLYEEEGWELPPCAHT